MNSHSYCTTIQFFSQSCFTVTSYTISLKTHKKWIPGDRKLAQKKRDWVNLWVPLCSSFYIESWETCDSPSPTLTPCHHSIFYPSSLYAVGNRKYWKDVDDYDVWWVSIKDCDVDFLLSKTCYEHDKLLCDWPITSIAFCTPHYQRDLDRYISYMSNWDMGCDPFQLCKWHWVIHLMLKCQIDVNVWVGKSWSIGCWVTGWCIRGILQVSINEATGSQFSLKLGTKLEVRMKTIRTWKRNRGSN